MYKQNKLYSLESIVNFPFIPKVVQKGLRALKWGIKSFLQFFITQHISTHYYVSYDKKLR